MFNFEELASLAKTDPQKFEERRRQLINEEILKAPAEHRETLIHLQRDLDTKRSELGGAKFLTYCMTQINNNLEDLEDQFRCMQVIVSRQ